MQKINVFSSKRLVLNGLFIALFFILSLFSVEISGIKITFDSLAVVLAAVLFGPADAFIVGLLGAFFEQLFHFGFTVTTILWILPPAIRGLLIGLGMKICNKGNKLWIYYIVCIIAAICTSLFNTIVYYLDSKIFGYYHYAIIFGVLFLRLLTGVLSAAITATASLPILKALKKSHLLQ